MSAWGQKRKRTEFCFTPKPTYRGSIWCHCHMRMRLFPAAEFCKAEDGRCNLGATRDPRERLRRN